MRSGPAMAPMIPGPAPGRGSAADASAPLVPGYGLGVSEPLQLLLTRRWLRAHPDRGRRPRRFRPALALAVGPRPPRRPRRRRSDRPGAGPGRGPAVRGPARRPSYGRQVTVRGAYAAAGQRLVPRGDVYWVVTPAAGRSRLVVPVVRGTVTTTDAPAPPAGEVSVQGRVEPYEGDPGRSPPDAGLPPGQLPRLAPSALTGVVDGPLAGGWVALDRAGPGVRAAAGDGSELARGDRSCAGRTRRTPCSGCCSRGSSRSCGSAGSATSCASAARSRPPGNVNRRVRRVEL